MSQDDDGHAWATTSVVRFGPDGSAPGPDAVAREEPLEIQLGGTALAVVMRTPGHDRELALGFLRTERVIESVEQVVSVRHCRHAADPASADNVVRVVLREDVRVDWEALRRHFYASSSCGLCGKATIDNALAVAPPLEDDAAFHAAWLTSLPVQLERAQRGFARTGGLHAAALFAPDGSHLVTREDVGRHNAVDKVLGWALRHARTSLAGHVLLVSGRVSFEIVQKALAARIPLVAGVSAPSSLAIEFAERARLTLVGFLRGPRFNVYGDVSRVQGATGERVEADGEAGERVERVTQRGHDA
ncbi:MAG: formate dehydrogenase accessory sulfurtransferase FdhD [Myxococcota bacterium]